ncbi:MAG TPA: mycothiol conjugate amidase Mca [Acidimicrobiales bacterium]|nr:mycothiol conjugate amidase Mca [Acidimicrobiales bacterium]
MPEGQRLCLLTVHAHPDDESSKGAGTVAKYHAEGVHTVLVCCTGGEAGDILNPAMDTDEVKSDLGAVRRAELDKATAVIGYDEVVLLGYRDSGMPDSDHNKHPECFANAELDEAVGRLVAVIRRTKPQVIVTYHEDQRGYPHPDHIRVHDVTLPAFDAAADPDKYPEAGPAWQPLKLYYTSWSRKRMIAMHEKFEEMGIESPFGERIGAMREAEAKAPADPNTTVIDISDYADIRRDALLAHATQIDPTSPFWFGLPPEVARTVYPFDDYVLARSLVESDIPEDDLFAGVRESVRN